MLSEAGPLVMECRYGSGRPPDTAQYHETRPVRLE